MKSDFLNMTWAAELKMAWSRGNLQGQGRDQFGSSCESSGSDEKGLDQDKYSGMERGDWLPDTGIGDLSCV